VAIVRSTYGDALGGIPMGEGVTLDDDQRARGDSSPYYVVAASTRALPPEQAGRHDPDNRILNGVLGRRSGASRPPGECGCVNDMVE